MMRRYSREQTRVRGMCCEVQVLPEQPSPQGATLRPRGRDVQAVADALPSLGALPFFFREFPRLIARSSIIRIGEQIGNVNRMALDEPATARDQRESCLHRRCDAVTAD